MLTRFAAVALVVSVALAQTPETPADVQAYTQASRTMDPQKKIDALEQWKKEFPDSEMRESADMTILATLARHFPSQQDRIRDLAGQIYNAAPEKTRGPLANRIAISLLDNNVLLNDAEEYAQKSVEAGKGPKLLKSEQAERLAREAQAGRIGTLGRIEVALGKTEDGRKLLEQAHADNPNLGAVNAALGELAAQAGDDQKGLEYLIPAALSGAAPPSANTARNHLSQAA